MQPQRSAIIIAIGLALLAAACVEDGAQGPQGPQGPSGENGENGENGDNGANGENGENGDSGVTSVALQLIGRFETGVFDEGAAEIVSYDAAGQRVFQVNANSGQVDVLDVSTPDAPVFVDSIDVATEIADNTAIETELGHTNSVAVRDGIVAVAIAADAVDEPGVVALFQASDLAFVSAVEVGFLPDAVAFSPDGTLIAVANEGEPDDDYTVDPIGSVSIIDLTDGVAAPVVTTLDFTDFNEGDDRVNIRTWPIYGLLMPDTIATYEFLGETLVVTANEGDTRDYDGFSEEADVGDLDLDPEMFPDAATLQDNANLGRLLTTTTLGDDDEDGDYDRVFSMGGRSFSIYTASGDRLFDSGNDFEVITAFRLGDHFNADNDDNDFDGRSDAKGPEPEALEIAHIGGAVFAFIGLERAGGIMVYNISNPHSPRFIQYVVDRDFSEEPSLGDTNEDDIEESNPAAGDLGPESITFVPAADSPDGTDLLIVGTR